MESIKRKNTVKRRNPRTDKYSNHNEQLPGGSQGQKEKPANPKTGQKWSSLGRESKRTEDCGRDGRARGPHRLSRHAPWEPPQDWSRGHAETAWRSTDRKRPSRGERRARQHLRSPERPSQRKSDPLGDALHPDFQDKMCRGEGRGCGGPPRHRPGTLADGGN